MLGRTEDIRFSPNNRLLAIAGFGRRRVLLLEIDLSRKDHILIGDFVDLASDDLGEVHGIDFIDDATLVVANRDGHVVILAIPAQELGGRTLQATTTRTLRRGMLSRIRSPGSIAVRRRAFGLASLYVCQNYRNRVSHHVVVPGAAYAQVWSNMAAGRDLDVPDGIAISPDARWIAISSHGTHDVKIYETDAAHRIDAQPAGVLSGVGYPHGLRFTPDGRHLVVADAGQPVLQVYSSKGDWRGQREPTRTVQVMDPADYMRGKFSEEEGGPKGIDIDRTGRVLAVTTEMQPLRFFATSAIVAGNSSDKA